MPAGRQRGQRDGQGRPADTGGAPARNRLRERLYGGDERARGEVTLKDLALGAELAKSVESRTEWVGNREAQKSVKRADLVAEVKAMLKGRV